jgi:hypothetical protein
MAAYSQGYMSTISSMGIPSDCRPTPLPTFGPNVTEVIEQVKEGTTSLKQHPDVADKLFVHYVFSMPPEVMRGPHADALDWIEKKLQETC